MIDAQDFWSSTRRENDCLIWTGPTNKKPVYGIYAALGGRLVAHRVAFDLTNGSPPRRAHIARTCKNPLCVEPKHLYLQNPTHATDPVNDDRKRIETMVEVNSTGCWTWKDKQPRVVKLHSGIKTVRRAVFETFKTPIPLGMDIRPTCGNEACLNPEHLGLLQRATLGRSNSKLTAEQVKEIRELAKTGKFGLIDLAEQFKTSRQTIYTVVYNLGWYDESYTPPTKMPRRRRFCREGHRLDETNSVELESGRRLCKVCQDAAVLKVRKSFGERFWDKVDKSGECWLWTAYTHNGCGYISRDRTPQLAHRIAYELHHGSLPVGANVLHSCDNRNCVRPDHLYLDEVKMAAK